MKGNLRVIIGVVLSAVLLWWSFRSVHFGEVMTVLSHANIGMFAIATVCATLIFPLRARRWRTILDPIFPKLPFGPLWRSTAVGMMISNTVPARAGEFARAYALTRETPVPFSTSIASIAVDRVFDAIILLALAFAALLDPKFPHGVLILGRTVPQIAAVGCVGVLVLLVGLYSLVFFPAQLIRLFELFARKMSPKLEERGRAALLTFADGLSVLRSPVHFSAVFLWTLAHWLLNAFGWWISMRAVGIDVPFSATLLVQTLVALGVAVPSTPGFVGVFEAASIAGLAVYGVPKELAVSWALGFHVASFIPITVIGIYYFLRMGLNLKEIRTQQAAA